MEVRIMMHRTVVQTVVMDMSLELVDSVKGAEALVRKAIRDGKFDQEFEAIGEITERKSVKLDSVEDASAVFTSPPGADASPPDADEVAAAPARWASVVTRVGEDGEARAPSGSRPQPTLPIPPTT
jgi:hypothetical protein